MSNPGILFKIGTWDSQICIGLASMKHQDSISDAILDIVMFGDVAFVRQIDLPGIPASYWHEAVMVELKQNNTNFITLYCIVYILQGQWHPTQS